MFKFPKNKWFWIPIIVWSSLVIFGEFFLGNLIYSALIQKLKTYGIEESDMISALIHIGLPLVLIAVGFYIMYFCFQKAVSVQVAEELLKSKEILVSPGMRRMAKLAEVILPKTRLDKWFEFLDLKICQGNKYSSKPLFKRNDFIKYFDQVHNGFLTAIEDKTKFYRWLNPIGVEYKSVKEHEKFGFEENHDHIKNILKIILNCLDEFRTINPTNDVDFRKEFNGNDLIKYKGEECR